MSYLITRLKYCWEKLSVKISNKKTNYWHTVVLVAFSWHPLASPCSALQQQFTSLYGRNGRHVRRRCWGRWEREEESECLSKRTDRTVFMKGCRAGKQSYLVLYQASQEWFVNDRSDSLPVEIVILRWKNHIVALRILWTHDKAAGSPHYCDGHYHCIVCRWMGPR